MGDCDSDWLNEDFKASKSAVTLCLKGLGPNEDLPAGSVLQIQSVTNISVPMKSQLEGRENYDAKKHVLKILFTDGKETVSGVLYDYHPKLSTETLPGTKIKTLKPISFTSKLLRLSRGNDEILGGYVANLVDNYKVQKEHEKKQVWGKTLVNSGEEGPPKWRTLQAYSGNAGIGNVSDLRSAKAMEILEEAKNKGNPSQAKDTQFDVQRQEAILDLAKKKEASKKNFSVAKIIPIEQPAASNTNVKTDSGPKPRENKFQKIRDSKREEEEVAAQYEYRRGKQISLQDFFTTDKSKISNSSNQPTDPSVDSVTSNFESFNVRSDDRGSYRGGRGGPRRGFEDRSDRSDFGQQEEGYRRGRGRGRGGGRGRGRGDYSRTSNFNDGVRPSSQYQNQNQRPYDASVNNEVRYVQDFPTLGNDPFQVTSAPGNYDFQLGESGTFQRSTQEDGYRREDRQYEPVYRGRGCRGRGGGFRGNRGPRY